ncbi:hypothetical protein M407DRAFT_112734 [Tulasnella calospora MUT 4182]|uniref:Uncharacterized protein n=1 Tax=Tulasnella calospora MUT 4182 TaxID=1051891 RepID=A0A0C3KP34_9AGAM|nr:hypothetical protein M407DRAFT_112734 [Tulasnella calospora MUT 4182]
MDLADNAENSDVPDKQISVKLALLGDCIAGKSSIIQRFVSNEFQETITTTIGAGFFARTCRLEDRVIRFEIWDTAGRERFRSLAPMYYRGAQVVVVAYDVTQATSFGSAKSWVKEVQRQANPNIIALVANKMDLITPSSAGETENLDALHQVEAHEYATKAGLLFFEASAKTGEGIVEIFTEIAKKIPMTT